MFLFLKQNDFIEAETQTSFTPKIAGVLEHTSMMAHFINKACIKQHSLVVTLLDLKNDLITYHLISTKVKSLISSLYSGQS